MDAIDLLNSEWYLRQYHVLNALIWSLTAWGLDKVITAAFCAIWIASFISFHPTNCAIKTPANVSLASIAGKAEVIPCSRDTHDSLVLQAREIMDNEI
jgi:hypothetical protein